MPTVRNYQRTTTAVRVLPTGQIGARVTPESLGAVLGAALSESGARIYDKARRDQNDIAFMAQVRQLSDNEASVLYDPENGAFATRGKDALDIHDSALGQIDSNYQSVLASAANPDQKLRLEVYQASQRESVSRDLLKHSARQMEIYDDEETTQFVQSSIRNVGENFSNPIRVSQEIANAESAITAHGIRNGKSIQWIENTQYEATSKMHAQVLDQMIVRGMDMQASAYVVDNFEDITHEDRIRVATWVQSANINGQANRIAGDILATGKGDITDHYKAIAAITDKIGGARGSQIRAAAEARVDKMHAVEAQAEADRRDLTADAMTVQLEASKGDMRTVSSRKDWDTLDRATKSAIRTYAARLAAGDPIPTNMNELYYLINASSDPLLRSEFARTNLWLWRPHLDDEDFKYVAKLQKTVREGLYEKANDLTTNLTRQREAQDDALRELKLTEAKDPEKVARFRRQSRDRIRRFEQSTGKPIDDTSLQGMLDTMVEEISTTGFFDTHETAGLIEIDDIPDDDAERIRVFWRQAHGQVATDDDIRRIYVDAQVNEERRTRQLEARDLEAEAFREQGLPAPGEPAPRRPEAGGVPTGLTPRSSMPETTQRPADALPIGPGNFPTPRPASRTSSGAIESFDDLNSGFRKRQKKWSDDMIVIQASIAATENQLILTFDDEFRNRMVDEGLLDVGAVNDYREIRMQLETELVSLRREQQKLRDSEPLE